eukprot:10985334-Karenia_brevis.AAC.1
MTGLKIHMGKTKALTNCTSNRAGNLNIYGNSVDILQGEAYTDYLGKRLCLTSVHDAEIHARIDKAWKKFFSLKRELCGKHVSLKSRIRLFNCTVTPTLLYGSGSWTMTSERERLLRTSQRRMLRWMLEGFFGDRDCRKN